ncbi:hypothetical protein [Roseateles asaccharophilus]|uniref:DUF1833 domain-containing protein n=1 Tax=Roseateles asaccharophilus TaxID=582607 RepID=A0ABU2A7K5_9BURK|nr:hypothetical protein [Roseateles asaccharophilus]MDR7331998.1 hypothetical protein [Roseateles asaccharophilus]
MSLKPSTRVYDEFIGDTFAVPTGRLIGAELRVVPFSLASGSQHTDDSLQLLIEVRSRPGADFEVAAESPLLSQYQEVSAEVMLPLREAPGPDADGQTPAVATEAQPVARFRLIHAGRQVPRYDIRLIGL